MTGSFCARVPFRISFFGGGTDFKEWYDENPSSVISASINLYSYVTVRQLLPVYDHSIRLRYYKREEVNSVKEIQHPTARNILNRFGDIKNIEIIHFADLPSRTGVASSSTFTVGLLHCMHQIRKNTFSQLDLAKEAIYIEQELNKEIVGCQDQIAVACGGFNRIYFNNKGLSVESINIDVKYKEQFQDNLLMFFTGQLRDSSTVLQEQVSKTKKNAPNLLLMSEMVGEAHEMLKSGKLIEVGSLLNESWKMKKSLSEQISNTLIDDAYEMGLKAGALGGKILGAGGGGFLLLYAEPEYHSEICKKLSPLPRVKFRFESSGSTIIPTS